MENRTRLFSRKRKKRRYQSFTHICKSRANAFSLPFPPPFCTISSKSLNLGDIFV